MEDSEKDLGQLELYPSDGQFYLGVDIEALSACDESVFVQYLSSLVTVVWSYVGNYPMSAVGVAVTVVKVACAWSQSSLS